MPARQNEEFAWLRSIEIKGFSLNKLPTIRATILLRHQVGGFVFYHQPTATYFCKVFLTLAAFLPLFLKQNNLLFFDK